MKRTLFILCILSLLLAACRNKDEETETSSISVVENETETETETEEITETQTESQTETEIASSDMARGTVDKNVYKNTFFDIEFSIPEGWMTASQEELTYLEKESDIETGSSDDPNADGKMTFYDFMASDPGSGDNVIMGFDDLYVGGFDASALEYINQVKEKAPDAYKSMGNVDVSVTEPEIKKLGDKDYQFIKVSVKVDDQELLQHEYCRKEENMMLFIIFTGTDEERISGIEALIR